MKSYPEKLLILYKLVEYRYVLTAIDDVFVMHHRAPDDFLFELRPPLNLTMLGTNSYSSALLDLAGDLEDGYHLLVNRDQFLENLEAMALRHAPAKSRDAVDEAVQLIAERTPVQIHHHRDTTSNLYSIKRMCVGSDPRKTARCYELDSLDCMSRSGPRGPTGCGTCWWKSCSMLQRLQRRWPPGRAGAHGTGLTCRRSTTSRPTAMTATQTAMRMNKDEQRSHGRSPQVLK